ncbi:MAG: AbiV family abortive infection protein [Nitrosotalea sp.]
MKNEKNDFKKLTKIREACLKNAEDFINSADALENKNVEHIRFHLAVLALEEIGKAELLQMKFIANKDTQDPDLFSLRIDDHEKKLFWAFWGPAFSEGKITKSDIDSFHGLAKTVHYDRLNFLYIDPENPLLPQDKVSMKEVTIILGLSKARLGMEKSKEMVEPDPTSEEAKDMDWFITATQDDTNRKLIFGGPSIKKLSELKEVKVWVKWLREQFEKTAEENRKLVETELNRSKPTGKEANKKKWRIKVKIISESHSLRNRPLNEWNKNVDMIQLSSNDKNELTCTFFLPKSWHVKGLWLQGWGLVRAFVTALNIASRGFFWWNVPKDRGRYYEEIWDLENNAGMGVQAGPELTINWKDLHLVLDKNHLLLTNIIFFYITKVRGTPAEEPFNHYVEGLSFLAKTDIHTRFEPNVFAAFFAALKSALKTSGTWDGKEDYKTAVKRAIQIPDQTELERHIDIGVELEKDHMKAPSKPITLTEVFGMKLYCDVYLATLARVAIEKEKKKKA